MTQYSSTMGRPCSSWRPTPLEPPPPAPWRLPAPVCRSLILAATALASSAPPSSRRLPVVPALPAAQVERVPLAGLVLLAAQVVPALLAGPGARAPRAGLAEPVLLAEPVEQVRPAVQAGPARPV